MTALPETPTFAAIVAYEGHDRPSGLQKEARETYTKTSIAPSLPPWVKISYGTLT
jgi:hypothetical protein